MANGTNPSVVAGQAGFSTAGKSLNVTNSPGAIINWQGFSIGADETTRFIQQSAASSVLNRVFGPDPSVILGALSSNGRVFLINPSGILFGQGARIDVAGLVASTLDLSNQDYLAGRLNFTPNALAGKVENQGTITTPSGGSVYLVGSNVSNSGLINSPQGDVILAAGRSVKIFDSSTPGVRVELTASDNSAVNLGEILAQSGQVGIYGAALRNAGIIDANQVVRDASGKIVLRAKQDVTLDAGSRLSASGEQAGEITVQSEGGTVNVGGTLDASAPNGGDGGFIETSAAHVKVADNAKITTAAPQGKAGTWLIDPQDFTIGATATGTITGGTPSGDVSGSTLSTALGSGSVTILSSQGSTAVGNGDINVNDTVDWSANTLTLTAVNDINVNAVMTASGTASLALNPGTGMVVTGRDSSGSFIGRVDFSGTGALAIGGTTYTVISSLGAPSSVTGTDLQGMNGVPAGHYALGADIDASATSGGVWGSTGFLPIGAFTGTFDGLGHTIAGLTINSGAASAGLFGATGTTSTFNNVGLVGGSVTGAAGSGGLIGTNGAGSTVNNSYNTGSVSGAAGTGGLVGNNTTGAISNSYSTGNVNGAAGTGGLVGTNTTGAISNSYSTSTVVGSGAGTGGLVGSNTTGAVSKSYASGSVTGGGADTGGLLGSTGANAVSDSYATGSVSGTTAGTGGLIGTSTGTVATSYAAGKVTATGGTLGGLVGVAGAGSVTNSFWDETTTLQTASAGGGLGMTTAEMQTQANFTSATTANGSVNPNWGFANTWVMYNGLTYPLLRPFMTPLTVTANNHTITYNGVAYSGGNGVTPTPGGNLLGTVSYSGTSQGAINVNSYVITPSGLYSNQQGYIIGYADGTLTVTAKALTAVDLVGSVTKEYDGNATVANLATGNYRITGFISGEGATIGVTSGTYDAGKNVQGPNSAVSSASLVAGDYTQDAGTLLTNYDLSAVTGVSATGAIGAITAKALSLTPITASKEYDGLISSPAAVSVVGNVAGDTVTVAEEYASKDVMGVNGSTLGIQAGYTIVDGALADMSGNYSITDSATAAGTITAKALTAVDLVGSVTKEYDGNATVANLATGNYRITGFISGEGATIGVTSGTYDAGKNVQGPNSAVSSASLVAGDYTQDAGTLLTNYDLSAVTGVSATGAIGAITAKALSLTPITASKEYDGLISSPAAVSVVGNVAGDTVTVAEEYASKDVMGVNGSTLGIQAGYTIVDGALADMSGNYSITDSATAAGTITAKALTAVDLVGSVTKEYDGNATVANLATGNYRITGFISGEGATIGVTSGTYDAGKNVQGPNSAVSSASLVAGDYTQDAGTLLTNYDLSAVTGVSATGAIGAITAKALSLTPITASKEYDGLISSPAAVSVVGNVAGDTVTVAEEYASKDVMGVNGSTLGIQAGYTIVDGALADMSGNYSITDSATAAGTITAKALTAVDLVGSVTKEYDGNATVANLATGNYRITGFISGEGATIGVTSGTYDAGKNVQGPNSAVSSASLVAGDYTQDAGTLLTNYDLSAVTGVSATGAIGAITAKALSLTPITASKEYDGLISSPAAVSVVGNVAGDTVTVAEEYASKDVMGVNGSTLGIQAGYTIVDGALADMSGNYSITDSATAAGTITAKALTAVDLVGSVTKEYDGNATVANLATGNYRITGFISGEGATIGVTSGTYDAGKNVQGPNSAVSSASLVAGDYTQDAGTLLTNYDLSAVTGVSATGAIGAITAKALSLTPITASKEYDGLISSPAAVSVVGNVAGDTVTVAEEYASKDVMGVNGSTLGIQAGYTIVDGALADMSGNYSITDSATAAGTITAKALTAVDLVGSVTKEYDGNATVANLATGNYRITGFISGEGATIGVTSGTYDAGKNVQGPNSAVSSASLVAGDYTQDAGTLLTNYDLSAVTGVSATGAIGAITAKALSLTPITASKEYDGLISSPAAVSVVGNVAGDTVTVAEEYASKDVMGVNGSTLGIQAGYTIVDGALADMSGNYSITDSATAAGTITAKALTAVDLVGSVTKEYDGNATVANLATGNYRITGFISGEGATIGVTSGTYDAGKNVQGPNSAVSSASLVAGDYTQDAGTLLTNYDLSAVTGVSATGAIGAITATNLILSGTRVYDGSNVFAGSNLTAMGAASETFAVTGAGDTTNLASKNVQSGSTLASLTGLALGASSNGGLAGNYTALSTLGSSVDVTALPITLTAPSVTKTYDGGTTYATTGADLAAIGGSAPLVGSDTISAATITYANRDFGLNNKTVTLSGSTIDDGNSGLNYAILAENGNSTSTINKAALTVAANPQSKVYGAIDPALSYTAGAFQFGDTAASVLSGVLSRAAGEDVNTYPIGQNTLASNANYTLAYTGNSLAITPAPLDVAANPQSKLFGTPDPALTYGVTGLVNNPALGVIDSAGSVLSGALTRVPGESALGGPYAITQGTLSANSNYALGFTPSNLIIIGAAAEPVLGFNVEQVVFAGVVNYEFYYRPGNFWHISLNPNNADPGFDVMRGTGDLKSRLGDRLNRCDSVSGGGFCETWSFPQQRK